VAETDDGMPVDELIAEVKEALIEAGVTGNSHIAGLRVRSVRLTLKVVATEAGGGKVNFRVPFIGTNLTVGASHAQQDAHSIDITLVPPDRSHPAGVHSADVQDILVSAIWRIRQAVASAADGEDPWFLSDATVDISFGVTKEKRISVVVEGNLSNETANTLRLTLAPA
jgi:Trypsin-co-occurring domain 2